MVAARVEYDIVTGRGVLKNLVIPVLKTREQHGLRGKANVILG